MEARKRRSTRRRKTATTVRRRRTKRTQLSAAPGKRRVHRRRRSAGSSRVGLSEMFNKPAMNTTVKAIASGVVGAFVGTAVMNFFPSEKPLVKAAIITACGLVVGSALKMPNVAAGITGVGLYNVIKSATGSQGVSEGYLSQAQLDQLPAVLSEDYQLSASPMALAESPFQFSM